MSTVTAATVDPINEKIGSAKADVATYTKEISNIKTEIGKLGILPTDLKTREDYRGYITKAEALLAKSKADLLKAEKEKAVATKIALKAAKKAEVVTKTELKEPVKSDKTPKQILALAELDVEEAQSKVTDLTNEISQLEEAITGLKKSPANTTELKAKQDRLSKVKRELIDAKGVVEQKQKEVETLVTKQGKEEVLASGPATTEATTEAIAAAATTETTVTPESGSKPSTVTDTTGSEEVRFTFLKQRFIVENKFDGDKLLPKQRAFMTAMNILPIMASIDEKELVKVLENIVNNKNCRSDTWIGLSVKCGPIRTLLNTLADRLWVYLGKDPDILSRQARLATGAVGGPGSVPGSLSPLGQSLPSGIPPGGHPFDPKNDTIITIKLPLRSLYESAFGPSLLTMFETSDAGTKLKTGVRNLETEASNATRNTRGDMSQANIELNDTLKNLVNEYLNSSSSSSISPSEQTIIDTMRSSILVILEELKKDQPTSIEELKDHYGKTIDSVLESLHPPENASQGLINKIIPIIQAINNFVPSSSSVPASSSSSIPAVLDTSITDPIIKSIKDKLDEGNGIAKTLTGPNGAKYSDFSRFVKTQLDKIKTTAYMNVNEFKTSIGNMINKEKNSNDEYKFLTTEKRFQDLFREIDQILST